MVYVDGFSGPWQAKDEQFADTSFGIALRTLTLPKETWANSARRRRIGMTAQLVEENKAAFARLSGLQTMFPNVRVVCHNSDFTEAAPRIAASLPPRAFAFVLVDPKGWKVDLQAIAPLIARNNCEVVFNFMFDFINRFALSDHSFIAAQMDRLIPGRDWRSRIQTIDTQEQVRAGPGHRASDARKQVLAEEFRNALCKIGHYPFVAHMDVLRPTKDRTLYLLVYGTRQPPGIEVFRDCQVQSLEQQSDIRAQSKLEGREKKSRQMELLTSTNEMGPDLSMVSFSDEALRARQMLRDLVPPTGPGIRWDHIWPKVLSQCVIRLTSLKQIANEERKAGILEFPDWPGGAKRTPENDYLVRRGRTGIEQTPKL